jgi:hypothetical protein
MGLRRIKAPVYVQTPEPGDPDYGIDSGIGIDNSLPGQGGHPGFRDMGVVDVQTIVCPEEAMFKALDQSS